MIGMVSHSICGFFPCRGRGAGGLGRIPEINQIDCGKYIFCKGGGADITPNVARAKQISAEKVHTIVFDGFPRSYKIWSFYGQVDGKSWPTPYSQLFVIFLVYIWPLIMTISVLKRILHKKNVIWNVFHGIKFQCENGSKHSDFPTVSLTVKKLFFYECL